MELLPNKRCGRSAPPGSESHGRKNSRRVIAWAQELQTGYRIAILPGSYTEAETPNYWESRYGTFNAPIILEAVNGPETVFLPSVNIFDTRYLYLLNITIQTGGDAFHCERCDHLLIRGSRFTGAEPESYNTQETVKINQSQYVYVENTEIAGAWDNAVDLVAVQYGHFLNNRIHNAGDWCMYLKGGSAYFLVAQNEFYDCGAGGFTAGQGTGLQYMQPPWSNICSRPGFNMKPTTSPWSITSFMTRREQGWACRVAMAS